MRALDLAFLLPRTGAGTPVDKDGSVRSLDNRSSESESGLRDVLWPASFSHRPAARMAAHVLAGLTVEFVILLACAHYFWAGLNDSDRPTGHWFDIGAIAEGLAVCPAVPMVLMFCALVAGLRERRVARRPLTGLGRAATAVVNLLVSLLLILGSEQLSEAACAVASRPVPGGVDLMTAVLLCVMAAVGSGALISWSWWRIARRLDRTIGDTARYAAWLTVFSITAFVLPAGLFGHFGRHRTALCTP